MQKSVQVARLVINHHWAPGLLGIRVGGSAWASRLHLRGVTALFVLFSGVLTAGNLALTRYLFDQWVVITLRCRDSIATLVMVVTRHRPWLHNRAHLLVELDVVLYLL